MQKLKKFGLFTYGETIPGLMLYGKPAPYEVLNERAVRAGAGIVFALGMFSLFQAFYLQEFAYIKVLVVALFIDFLLKVVIGTKFSPLSRLSNLIVSKQEPEYVGAVQKRFAWSIGLVLSFIMVVMIFGFSVIGPVNLVICLFCLTLMFVETAFGVCIGYKLYGFLLARNVIAQPEYKPVCPGNVCSIE